MTKESTKKFLIAFTILWIVCFIPSLMIALGSLFTMDNPPNICMPFICIPLGFLFPIFIFKSISNSWSNYKQDKFKQAKLWALLPSGHLVVILLTIVVCGAMLFKHCYWPTSVEEYDDLVGGELFAEQFQQALDHSNGYIRFCPSAESYGSRGAAYEGEKKYAQAIDDYIEAARLARTKSQKTAAIYYAARAYYLAGNYKEALDTCNKVLKTYSSTQRIRGHESSIALRSAIYDKLGEHKLAQRDISELRKLGNTNNDPLEYTIDLKHTALSSDFSISQTSF